ncbi:hypothetical protein E1B28_008084 [Marasmius oreades]|uniref:Uncharacterized protein n=1 Tax=Marasmius oreades TaxID=181124 RepID=A0A9P7UVK7_9AGAR|nr:uncharacterized protein E1B28_008084 [Marasmius oreades]KAG7094486.1 hypothetical protein E1B28_008084 [Marasmius oreades]
MAATSSFFQDSHHMNFSGGNSFTNARTVVNHNYPALLQPEYGGSSDKECSTTRDKENLFNLAEEHGFRLIRMGDIIVEKEVSSDVLNISVKCPAGRVLKKTNPF